MSKSLSHVRPAAVSKFLYGSPYYPEHWSADERQGDPQLFADAGWNVIRIGEFAWNLFEPKEGTFDFALFDETIEQFGKAGIETIFCTPTAAPPRWVTRDYPETLRRGADGRDLIHGSRQQCSHFSPKFCELSERITQALADHYAGNPHVVGWQTDNEFHCHFADDHSPAAQVAFGEFLSRKYGGDIRKLNDAWGTAFWAQTYDCFEDVPLPVENLPAFANPAHLLDYQWFLSDGVTRFQSAQVKILRESNPDWFVTHNGCFRGIDYRGEFTKDLDFLGFDIYPFFEINPDRRAASQAANLDYTRSYSGNFLILEQQSGPGGQSGYLHNNPEPGEMREMAYVSIARGADGVLFFRERTCRFGAEEYWCGVLDHDNVPRRRYREAMRLGAELKRVGPAVIGTSVMVDVGIAGGDFAAVHGHQALSHGLPSPKVAGELFHSWFFDKGYAVGFVHPEDVLDGLGVYVVPHYALFDPAWVEPLQRWVEAGGLLVLGARSGCKTPENNVVSATLPGCLRELAGITVEEFGRQNRPDLRPLGIEMEGAELGTHLWYELLEPAEGTSVLATWNSRHLRGTAAITCRKHGNGAVVYVGTYLTTELLDALIPCLDKIIPLPAPVSKIAGVEVVHREGNGRRLQFIINHNAATVTYPVAGKATDLVGDATVEESIDIEPNGVAILQLTGRA